MRITWPPILAVGGGWLAIMPSSFLTLALRIDEIDAPALTYSLALTAGWGVLILGVAMFGRFADRHHANAQLQRHVLLASVLVVVALNVALSETYSDALLPAQWVLLQIPTAAIVAIAMTSATAAHHGDALRRTSAYIGAAPLTAILFGSAIVQFSPGTEWAFIVPSLCSALAVLPLLIKGIPTAGATTPDVSRSTHRNGWRWFLVASFLTSWTTSAATSYVVPYARVVLDTPSAELANASSLILMLATLLSLVSSLSLALGHVGRQLLNVGFPIGAALMTLGIALVVWSPSLFTLGLGACISGFGFGLVNGVELNFVRDYATEHIGPGQRIGQLTSATTIPYVAVPLTTTLLIRTGEEPGLMSTFWIAAAASAVALGVSRQFTR